MRVGVILNWKNVSYCDGDKVERKDACEPDSKWIHSA